MAKANLSPEIGAMSTIESLLSDLDDEARTRVLRWAVERFGLAPTGKRASPGKGAPELGDGDPQFEELADLYNSASPQTAPDRALIVSYWLQHVRGESEIESQRVNKELKHLGHGIGNITVAIRSLIDRRPQLMIQTRKSGKTKQARKKYKMTEQGKRAVQKMLVGELEE